MPNPFEKRVADFAEANGLFDSADKILLAVSGGADSTALMHAMCALKGEGALRAELFCGHINHQLRGSEADLDEEFVAGEAAKLGLPITTTRLDVRGYAQKNKLSIETAARKLRREGLIDIAKINKCKWIGTGHQKNDNAETIVQRLARGTGFRGLGGIWPMRSFGEEMKFIRPLLCVSREEIIEYLRGRGVKWREDHTNADCTYKRNFVRHRLIPALQQECRDSIVEQLCELAESARKLYARICREADEAWGELAEMDGERVLVDLKGFSGLAEIVKAELVRRSLVEVGSGERDLTQRHYEGILQLARRETGGRRIDLPGAVVVRREHSSLIFGRSEENKRASEQIVGGIRLEVPGQTRFGLYLIETKIFEAEADVDRLRMDSCFRRNDNEKVRRTRNRSRTEMIGGTRCVECFDLDKVKLPLVVRRREAGDRFWPLGLAGEKKVGKFLTAAKLALETRQRALIIADNEKIIWVWPMRMSENAKVTSDTERILQVQISESGAGRIKNTKGR
jgi:tRNA(Ile)-lysidine synthase